MAGQTPLYIDSNGVNHSVPDHFETVSIFLKETNIATGDDLLLHICERETIVDSIYFRGEDGDQDLQLAFKKAPDGTAIASGQAFGLAIGVAAETRKAVTIDTAHNIIEAGSVIGVTVTDSSANLDKMIITMRIRTRV